jgi:MFS superfamily sulfate permease-like transporter
VAIPLTGVIVRSAANIEAGARTRLSAILHAVWLLLAVLLVPGLLNRIPLAALAAVLLHVGWKLAHPLQLIRAWQIGRDQFIPFFVTIGAILVTDLLVGVICGLLTGAFFILREHAQAPGLTAVSPPGAVLTRYSLGQQATFLSRVRISNTLDALPAHSRVEIDARGCRRIDPDVLLLLHEFRGARGRARHRLPTRRRAAAAQRPRRRALTRDTDRWSTTSACSSATSSGPIARVRRTRTTSAGSSASRRRTTSSSAAPTAACPPTPSPAPTRARCSCTATSPVRYTRTT